MQKKTNPQFGFFNPRIFGAFLLCCAGVSLAMFSFAATTKPNNSTTRQRTTKKSNVKTNAAPATVGPNPSSGTLIQAQPPLTFVDSVGPAPNATGEGVTSGAPTCAANGADCSIYTLTIDNSLFTANGSYDPTKAYVVIQLSWTPAAYEYGSFVEDSTGTVIAQNTAGTDPETISIPVTSLTAGATYTIVTTLEIGTPGLGYSGSVSLFQPAPAAANQCPTCIPPRYQMFFGPDNSSGEPSAGVDWNPNVASLKNGPYPPTAGTPGQNHTNLNTGGVAFFTANLNEYLVSFDDCASPPINVWSNITFPTEGVTTLDPIGFTDHFIKGDLGTSYPPPQTPGRTWQTQLSGVSSVSAFTDNDGQPGTGGTPNWTPTEGGGPPTGPDHETDGVGPYAPTNLTAGVIEPPHPLYSNAFYYCSQNIAGDAECSRSDDGGATFGPGVPIFQNISGCVGGIHGHVKVARDGSVYVPNFSCSLPNGAQGVAVSTDNGVTWTENNVTNSGPPKSTSSVDPQVAVGLNSVGMNRPGGPAGGQTSPTIYFAYNDQDGTMKVSASRDRGLSWSTPQDVGAAFGLVNTTFPFVIAGDDNRAAVGFLGTTTGGDGNSDNAVCPPAGAGQTAFTGIWHMYIATTSDGGNTWVTIDATPDSPVQVGPICRGGTLCPGYRNLLDFIGADVDSQGRALFAIAHGCPNCPNVGATCGSNNALSAMFRQSGGPRLFAAFDPPAVAAPAAPQVVSAVAQPSGGVLVSWLEPDNGGAPIIAYNIYRGTTSGGEGNTPIATIPIDATHNQTRYLDSTATGTTNYFYRVTAVNGSAAPEGESNFCQELSVTQPVATGNACTFPYLTVNGPGTNGPDSTAASQIQYVNIGEPFTSCTDNSITFIMKVPTFDAGVLAGTGPTGVTTPPPNHEYQILFTITDTTGASETAYVEMDTNCPIATSVVPEFGYGRRDPGTTGTFDDTVCTAQPGNPTASCPQVTGTVSSDGTVTIKLDVSQPLAFSANTGAATGKGGAFTWDARAAGTKLGAVQSAITLFAGCGAGFLETVSSSSGGDYTRVGNVSCSTKIPVAALTANPKSGNAPLAVTFDDTGSNEPAGACGTINSYTLDFGDGSKVTQSSPSSSISHTYNSAGTYSATLTVSDTVGKTSTNLAQQVITVSSTTGPAVTSVFSIKTHGTGASAPVFGVPLPLTGTHGIECRTGPTSGSHTVLVTFQNALSSVTSISATATTSSGTTTLNPAPTGSIGTGANNNQYTINLTGVPNASHVMITLHHVIDVAANAGDITIPMDVLLGDTTADGTENSADVSQTKALSGQTVGSGNFRNDVTVDGNINSADVSLVKAMSGTALP